MIQTNFISKLPGYSFVTNGLEEIKEQVSTHSTHTWNYLQEHDMLKGFPLSVICGACCAALFSCSTPIVGAIYGGLNYSILTIAQDTAYHFDFTGKIEDTTLIAISYIVTTIFMNAILSIPLSYTATASLAFAAFIGQFARRPTPDGLLYEYGMDRG